jgi:hypothetical protein
MAIPESKKHYAPPLPPGWDKKFTGPAWKGESFADARSAWIAFLRVQQNLRPCPRQQRTEPHQKKK